VGNQDFRGDKMEYGQWCGRLGM